MPDHFYVYPAYLTKSLSRTDGRRVPAALGVVEPTLEAIAAAAKSLGLTAEIEAERHYPRRFHEYAGRVKIAKKAGASKAKVLAQLAQQLQRAMPARSA